MKFIISITIALGLLIGAAPQQEETSTLTIRVEGLRNLNGYLGIALYTDSDEFPGDDPTYSKEVEVEDNTMEIVFEELEPGNYAIAIMHDENGNGEMDMNEYGMPLEGFGFSNEAQADMGPPGFDTAAIEVEGDTEQHIEMTYLGGY